MIMFMKYNFPIEYAAALILFDNISDLSTVQCLERQD